MKTAAAHNRENGVVKKPDDFSPDIQPGEIGYSKPGDTPVEIFESMMKAMGFTFVDVTPKPRKRKIRH